MLSPPPPPPPLPLPLFPLEDSASSAAAGGDHHSSYNPSFLIIAAIVAAAIIAASSIHLLLRVISRSRSPPFVHHLASTSSSYSSSSSSSAPSSPSDPDPKAVIDSLPLFSLSSSTAKPSSSSLDCAVCLSPFQLSDELRLLPACRHAFHSQCIDTWLKSNLSCPLCRSPISPAHTEPSPPPPAAEAPRSESFRIQIGSVSRRTDDSSASAPTPTNARSYSLGSSFEYVVEEEIEAVLARVRRRPPAEKSLEIQHAPPPPGEHLAEVAGGSRRSWLRDYVDRLASSASSSFSSLRFSQRGSHRFDSSAVAAGGGVSTGGESWDLERNLHLHLEEEDGGFSAFYRWLLGV